MSKHLSVRPYSMIPIPVGKAACGLAGMAQAGRSSPTLNASINYRSRFLLYSSHLAASSRVNHHQIRRMLSLASSCNYSAICHAGSTSRAFSYHAVYPMTTLLQERQRTFKTYHLHSLHYSLMQPVRYMYFRAARSFFAPLVST